MESITPRAIADYAARHSRPASPLRDELEAYTRAHCKDAQMLIGALEAALLQMLIGISGTRRVLEVGLFTGYSALAMAEALPADGTLVSCEINPGSAAIARSFFARSPHGRKITVLPGDAKQTLPTLAGPFDLAFLDADKESYNEYYDLVLPRLRPGGLLVADNVLWSGRVLDPVQATDRALVEFNRRVQADERVENVLLTVRDGVMVARKC